VRDKQKTSRVCDAKTALCQDFRPTTAGLGCPTTRDHSQNRRVSPIHTKIITNPVNFPFQVHLRSRNLDSHPSSRFRNLTFTMAKQS
jgi:hypothetical protein